MSLAPYVAALGRGPSKGRHLTAEEAQDAMRLILSGKAEREAVGAILMLLRYRGESPEELAGFVRAMRDAIPAWPGPTPALDWPSYAAGKSRGVPWFLLSARLVAQSGLAVLLHGWNSHQAAAASVTRALPFAGIPTADSLPQIADAFARHAIAYVPLELLSPAALGLLKLRDVLGLRSAVNTALRALNPAAAPASVQGVFHPPYRELQVAAGHQLGQRNLVVIKGGGGEFERHPSKGVTYHGWRDGARIDGMAEKIVDESRRLADDEPRPESLAGLWEGRLDDPFAEAVVIGTAALALLACGRAATEPEARALARSAWDKRHLTRAA